MKMNNVYYIYGFIEDSSYFRGRIIEFFVFMVNRCEVRDGLRFLVRFNMV